MTEIYLIVYIKNVELILDISNINYNIEKIKELGIEIRNTDYYEGLHEMFSKEDTFIYGYKSAEEKFLYNDRIDMTSSRYKSRIILSMDKLKNVAVLTLKIGNKNIDLKQLYSKWLILDGGNNDMELKIERIKIWCVDNSMIMEGKWYD